MVGIHMSKIIQSIGCVFGGVVVYVLGYSIAHYVVFIEYPRLADITLGGVIVCGLVLICIYHQREQSAFKQTTHILEEKTRALEHIQQEQHQMMLDIAHELQTPLTIIKSELHELKQQLGEHPRIETFERSVHEISLFIYDLLRLARMDSTEKELARVPVSISDVLEELIEYFKVLMEQKDIVCEYTIEPNVWVVGERAKLEEVIVNLVSNSVKYIRPDERVIRLSLHTHKKDCVITVDDTGIGISADVLPHIFDRFYRSQQHKQGIRGSGLGLAIVKKITDKHNGTITVTSTPNKGTCVQVIFPTCSQP